MSLLNCFEKDIFVRPLFWLGLFFFFFTLNSHPYSSIQSETLFLCWNNVGYKRRVKSGFFLVVFENMKLNGVFYSDVCRQVDKSMDWQVDMLTIDWSTEHFCWQDTYNPFNCRLINLSTCKPV